MISYKGGGGVKGFPNKISKKPLPISKWAEIAPKDTPNKKKKYFKAVLAIFLKCVIGK